MSPSVNSNKLEEKTRGVRLEQGSPANTPYRKSFVLSLLVVVICACFIKFPTDDALRHVGLAFSDFPHKPISISAVPTAWGEVYPHSYFEVFKDYDPWFGYDLVLKIVASGLKFFPISPLLSQFLLIKILSLLLSLAFLYLALARSGVLEEIKDRHTFTLAYVILLLLILKPFLRMLIARPFSFGTLFVLYAVGQRGILKGALSSAVLAFFYPYLAWFYTIPVSLAHFLKGNRRFALGAILFTLVFLGLQPSSFWGFQLALFKSDLVRASINPKITEFFPSLNLLALLYLAGFLVLYPLFPERAKKLTHQNLVIIFYLIPSLKHIRYFVDLTLPLLFVSFGRELLTVLVEPYQKFTSSLTMSFVFWKNTLESTLQRLKLLGTRPESKQKHFNLKPLIVALYVLASVLMIPKNYKMFSSFKAFQADLSVIPQGSVVLTHFNLQYKILYVRPDLRIIPSCEMGFPTDSIRKEYVEFMNEGEVIPLARKTSAQFLLEHKRMYINPKNGEFLRLIRKGKNLNIWKVLHLSE
jgi:hypothetical protein